VGGGNIAHFPGSVVPNVLPEDVEGGPLLAAMRARLHAALLPGTRALVALPPSSAGGDLLRAVLSRGAPPSTRICGQGWHSLAKAAPPQLLFQSLEAPGALALSLGATHLLSLLEEPNKTLLSEWASPSAAVWLFSARSKRRRGEEKEGAPEPPPKRARPAPV
jgi:hypothetical protein